MDTGFAILNDTSFVLTCATSAWRINCHDENDVLPGEIFYRSNGPLWQTLFIMPTTPVTGFENGESKLKHVKNVTVTHKIMWEAHEAFRNKDGVSDLQLGRNIAKAVGLDERLIPTSLDTNAKQRSFIEALNESKCLYADEYHCSILGTWRVAHGGPRFHDGVWMKGDFKLMKVTREWTWNQGSFTKTSCEKYFKNRGRLCELKPPEKKSSIPTGVTRTQAQGLYTDNNPEFFNNL